MQDARLPRKAITGDGNGQENGYNDGDPPPPAAQISCESGAYAFLSRLRERRISLAKHRLSLGNPVRAREDATAPTPYYSPTLSLPREREREYGHQQGFTLIEMAIVLMIIGLIVGGVLYGRDLIGAAGARAEITQVEKFNAAANTFFGKYGALPGDLNAQVANQFGFAPRGPYAGQGDGNGVLEGNVTNSASNDYGVIEGAGETAMFWSDLTYANGLNVALIEGSFTSASPTTPPVSVTGTSLNLYLPLAKIGGGNYLYVYSTMRLGSGNPTNYFGLSAVSGILSNSGCFYCAYSNPGLTVAQSSAIDKKIDDGLPTSGRVLAQYVDGNTFGGTGWGSSPNAASPSSTTCYDTTSNQYSITQNNGNGVNCALSFRMQAGD